MNVHKNIGRLFSTLLILLVNISVVIFVGDHLVYAKPKTQQTITSKTLYLQPKATKCVLLAVKDSRGRTITFYRTLYFEHIITQKGIGFSHNNGCAQKISWITEVSPKGSKKIKLGGAVLTVSINQNKNQLTVVYPTIR